MSWSTKVNSSGDRPSYGTLVPAERDPTWPR